MVQRNLPEDWPQRRQRVGRRVRAARIDLNWSQEYLAFEAGISRNQVQYIESDSDGRGGTSNPTLEVLSALAHALDMRVVDLIAD